MKKNQKIVIVGIIIAIALVGIILSQTGFNLFSVVGTSTLSLTSAQLQSSNSYLSGKVWLLSFRAGGLGQSYSGTFSPSDVQSTTSDSSTTTKDFSLSVNYDDQICSYSITKTSSRTPIYAVQRKTWTCLLYPSESGAKDKSGFSNLLYYGFYNYQCYAIGYNEQYPIGNLNSPDIDSQFDITINANGKTATKTIDTLSGSTQGTVGDFAYAVWQGNLVSGKSCPDKDPYIPIYVSGTWRLGDSDAYDDYKSLLSTSPGNDFNSQDIWLSNIQNAISRAKSIQSFGSINSATSLENAIVKITLDDPVQFPVTTLYIKADTIGIYTPTPEGKISSVSSDCFKTGEQGGISVKVENIGSESGIWNLYAQCTDPFSSTSNIQISLSPGEFTTRVIPVSASASQETSRTCTIYLESPQGTKIATVGVCVKPQITCTADSLFCVVSNNQEVVKKCSSDGATSIIIDTCSANEYCEKGECKESGSEDGDSGFFDSIKNFFENIFSGISGFFGTIKIIVSIIVFIFTLLFGKDFFSNFKALKGKEWLAWIISGLIAVLLAYLVLTIFYVGLVVFAVYIIFRFITGGVISKLKGAFR